MNKRSDFFLCLSMIWNWTECSGCWRCGPGHREKHLKANACQSMPQSCYNEIFLCAILHGSGRWFLSSPSSPNARIACSTGFCRSWNIVRRLRNLCSASYAQSFDLQLANCHGLKNHHRYQNHQNHQKVHHWESAVHLLCQGSHVLR